MSEPTNVTEPIVPTGSGDADWDAAVAEVGPEPAAEPVAEPTPEAATPEPAASAAPAEPDFTPIKLENGDFELKLENGETYRGKSELELAQNIAKSKAEANRYISELKKGPKAADAEATPIPAAPPSAIDPASAVLADMTAQGLGFKDAAEMKAMIAEFRSTSTGYTQTVEQQRNNAVAAQFVQSTPDFIPTQANIEKMAEVFEKNQWAVTAENYEAAYHLLKGKGLLQTPPPTATNPTPPRAQNGQFAPTTPRNPLPPSGNAPSPGLGKSAPTLAEMEAMSPEELEKLMDGVAA